MNKNEVKSDKISIVSQFYYGCRTSTEIHRDRIDHFLRGHLSGELCDSKSVQDVVRKFVCIPGFEHIVIVYDQTQENRYVNEEFPKIYERDGSVYFEQWGEELKMHVSCEIPEINFKIHTRCFACRINEDGIFQNLEKGDYKQFIHFFPAP